MKNRKTMHLVTGALALMFSSVTAFAHNGVEHIMGTITAITDTSVTVETVKHTSVTVPLDPSTTFTNNDAPASRQDMKVGQRVVINAKQTSGKKLMAVSVKWGANSSAHGEHAEHTR